MIREKLKKFLFEEEKSNLSFKERFLRFIKSPKEVITFIIPLILIICFLIPMPYYITTGGGTINLNDKVLIEDSYDISGSFNSAYVSQTKANLFTYLLSFVIPSYEREKVSDVVYDGDTIKEYNFRERLLFLESINSALKVSFDELGLSITETSNKLIVTYILNKDNTMLNVADEILEVNNVKVSSLSDIEAILKNNSALSSISIKVLRDGKEVNTTSNLTVINGDKKIGITITNSKKYTTEKEVDFKFGTKEEGPSGGLMIALSIYNKLSEEDLTKGKKIVGTGTISSDGLVGEIGGVKYKLMGAVSSKADIFIVPASNYEEALALKNENNYNIKLISVDTFSDAIEKLKVI